MASIIRAINYLMHSRIQFLEAMIINCFSFLPDKLYLSLRYRCRMGYWINWKNPRTFAEKLQWLKLYNRKFEYTTMVDKYAVKKYVENKIGKEIIIPTIGVWNSPEDIDWDSLPNQFVLKTTHGGGSSGVVICEDKVTFNKDEAIAKLKNSYKGCIYKSLREWPYKNVPKRILAETLLKESDTLNIKCDLSDYKFYCFDGEPIYCQVIRNRRSLETIDFYDMKWNHMPFVGLNPVPKNGLNPVPKPIHLNKMIDICKDLSKGIPFLRIDLYVVDSKIYFGEITFYPASGMGQFNPKEWDIQLGDLIKLPKSSVEKI